MKVVVRSLALFVILISIIVPVGNEHNAYAAKSLSYNQVKKYQPSSHKLKFTYQQSYKGKKRTASLVYNKMFDGWRSSNDQVVPPLGYNVTKNMYLVGAPSSDFIYMLFEVPTKKGNTYKAKDFDGTLEHNTKILSISQTVKVKAGTYKNCIVAKDQMTGTSFYFAQNVGLILTKSKDVRIELVKVKK